MLKNKNKNKSAAHIPVVCLDQISLQAFSQGVFSPTAVDKVCWLQLHLGGMLTRAQKLLKARRALALCTCRGRCEGEVKATEIQQDTFPYLIVFLFFHGVSEIQRAN